MFKTLHQSVKLGVQDRKCILGAFWIIMNREVCTQKEYQDYGAMDSSITCIIHSSLPKCNHWSYGGIKTPKAMCISRNSGSALLKTWKLGKTVKLQMKIFKSLTKSIHKWKQIWCNPVTEYCLHSYKKNKNKNKFKLYRMTNESNHENCKKKICKHPFSVSTSLAPLDITNKTQHTNPIYVDGNG